MVLDCVGFPALIMAVSRNETHFHAMRIRANVSRLGKTHKYLPATCLVLRTPHTNYYHKAIVSFTTTMAERIAQTLKGKTAIVTGGSRGRIILINETMFHSQYPLTQNSAFIGLGTGLARELAARGACVLITYASSPKKAEEVVNEIQAANGSAKAIQADCENPDTAEKIVNLATTLLPSGKIDIIVNNAAFGDDLLIGDVSLDYWNKMLVTNLTFPFFLVKTALPHIAKGGRIVNISSTMAKERQL